MKKSIIRFLVFLILLSFIFLKYDEIFSFKFDDGIYPLSSFYKLEENSVDVLCLGSSKVFEGINPAILWDKYGIAAFDLGGSIQPLWNTYYYLKEALKTQNPELIILDAYRVMEKEEYIDDSRIIKNVAGMKWSVDKLKALMVSAPKDRWLEFGLEYIQYHRRYHGDITIEDFAEDKGNPAYYSVWKGFANNFDTTEQKKILIPENDGTHIKLAAKSEYWYRRIIELCRRENLPLLIVAAPCAGYDEEQQKYYYEASLIAEEYGTPFIDFNNYFEEMGLNYSTDFPEYAHLNYLGNVKYTNYLANYIKKNYDISDRRHETSEKYVSWSEANKFYENSLLDFQIKNITEIKKYIEMLSGLPEDYKVIVSVSGILGDNTANKDLLQFLDACLISYDQDYWGIYWMGSLSNMGVVSVQERPYEEKYGINNLILQSDGIYFKGSNYKENMPGVNIVVFDMSNMDVADSVYIDEKGIMHRKDVGG